jgi:nucleoside phosphorylase
LITLLRQVISRKRAESNTPHNFSSALGIVCALEAEFDAVQRLNWNFREVPVPGDPTLYMEGSFQRSGTDCRVVAALCPRMGMSAAAITATKLVYAFRPAILAMTGITAAVRGKANLGDVLIAEECWDWGMGKWMTHNGQPAFSPGPHHLPIDAIFWSAAMRIARDTSLLANIREAWAAPKPDTALRVVLGPLASGAAVISTQSMTDQIAAQHRKLIGIDMEAYGIYSAAAEAPIPRPRAIAIKAATDFADEQKADSWREYCCYTSAQVLRHLAERGYLQ